MDPSASRYADYSRQPKDLYGNGANEAEVPYAERNVRTYLPEGFFIREEKEKEKN
jgi:hypothetical protein